MRYELAGHTIRPPAEAESAILQLAFGCPHNACAFCGTYRDKPWRIRPASEFAAHVRAAREVYGPGCRRAFLADGDALALGQDALLEALATVREAFPNLKRISAYARCEGLLGRSDDDLRALRKEGLSLLYLGLESGSETVLSRIAKGAGAQQMIEGVRKGKRAGLRFSVMALIGLGGRELSEEHARETARALVAMDPRFVSLLTLRLVPGTPLERAAAEGRFEPLEDAGALRETRAILAGLEGARCVFRSDHASNPLPLAGTLPTDRERLLAEIDAALEVSREGGRPRLRPETHRGL